jgi:hypothetical protein
VRRLSYNLGNTPYRVAPRHGRTYLVNRPHQAASLDASQCLLSIVDAETGFEKNPEECTGPLIDSPYALQERLRASRGPACRASVYITLVFWVDPPSSGEKVRPGGGIREGSVPLRFGPRQCGPAGTCSKRLDPLL